MKKKESILVNRGARLHRGEKQHQASVEVWEVHLSQDQLGPIPK